VDYLDEILGNGEEKLDVVLQLTADDEELVHLDLYCKQTDGDRICPLA
jgi:hypothetical protein